jgi:tryptophan 2,3-dioxygenase
MSRAGPREPSAPAADMSYGDYLDLGRLLSAQHPLSDNHNELLFIIQHQTTELWLKLMLHELRAAQAQVRRDELGPAFKMLARVSRIMGQLIQAWDVLSTLTPSEYTDFRAKLGHASGFQSYQYRLVEFVLGNKDRARVAAHAHEPQHAAELGAALAAPSLYDEAILLLHRRGFAIAPEARERDWSEPHLADYSVLTAWTQIYRDPHRYWDLYELGEEFVDLEDYFRQWRFRHATTVERIIGMKPGTGGTSGVNYLRQRLELRLFPEVWDVRTGL